MFHGFKDFPVECPHCGEHHTLGRTLSTPSVRKANIEKARVGSVVEKHIEEAREEVKQEKERIKSKEYES